jgi:quinol monooxygenase YgiN
LSGLISGTGAKSKIRIVNTVRAEDGCEGYDYYFSAESPDTVLLVEKWASAKQQEAHLQTAHMAELMKIKEKYISDTSVEKTVL